MKLKYIIGIIVIAVAISVIVTTTGEASSYVDFAEAKKLSEKGFKKSIHVVGKLTKNPQGEVIGIVESPDKLSFKFDLVDNEGLTQTVLFAEPIPTDFIKSEQVVIIGAYQGKKFVADKILLKCPSKYEEEVEFTS